MRKNPQNEALELIERLVAISPEGDDGIRARAMALRDRIRNPMSVVLAKVPGETVEQKCVKIGVTRQNYYAWVRGTYRPNAKQAKKLAQITGLPLDAIRGQLPTESTWSASKSTASRAQSRACDTGTANEDAAREILVDAPENSGEAVTFLWIVFSLHDGAPTLWGLFHDKRNAERVAAKIIDARVERVIVCDKASREVLTPLIA